MAKVMFTLETSGCTGGKASEVQEELTTRTQAVLEHLKNENVEKLQTGGVSLARKVGGGYSSRGTDENTYKGSSMVTFEVPLARAGHALDGIASSGDISSCSVIPFAAQVDIDAARKEAMGEAAVKAREEAELLAAATGVRLGEMKYISVTNKNPSKMPARYKLESTPYGSAYPYPKHGETVFVDVRVDFEQTPLAA